jgi:hypothetical protein
VPSLGESAGASRCVDACLPSPPSDAGVAETPASEADASSASSVLAAPGGATKKDVRHCAQRTLRPAGPSFASSIEYRLAQFGQTMSMANQLVAASGPDFVPLVVAMVNET